MKIFRLMILVMFILLATLIYAEPDFYFKEGTPADIKIPCVNNGQACNSSTTCNITIVYPNGTNAVSNKAMTYTPAFFNYTLSNTQIVGQYSGFTYCTYGSLSGSTRFNLKINGTGESNTGSYMLFILLVILIIFAVVMSIIFSISGNPNLAQVFIVMSFILTTVFSYFGWQISQEWGAGWAKITYGFYLLLLFFTAFMFFMLLLDWTIAFAQYIMAKRKAGDSLS